MNHKRQDYLFAQLRRQLWFHREALAGRFPNMFTAAKALGVCVKTIQRDIEAMKDLGLNPQYDPVRFGFAYTTAPCDPIENIFRALLADPLPHPSHRAPRDPRPEDEYFHKHIIGEYDPAKSAAQFLDRYLNQIAV